MTCIKTADEAKTLALLLRERNAANTNKNGFEYKNAEIVPIEKWEEIPFFASYVPCGSFADGGDVTGSTLTLAALGGDSSLRFIVRAKGNSMIESGIRSGDLIEVEVTPTAEDGDIVVVRLGNDNTVKSFHVAPDGSRWLVPMNNDDETYRPIRVTAEMLVVGRVVMVHSTNPATRHGIVQRKMQGVGRSEDAEPSMEGTPADGAEVEMLRPFFGNDEDVRSFVAFCSGKPSVAVTRQINMMVAARRMHFASKNALYDVLFDCGLYTKSRQNFSQQVGG